MARNIAAATIAASNKRYAKRVGYNLEVSCPPWGDRWFAVDRYGQAVDGQGGGFDAPHKAWAFAADAARVWAQEWREAEAKAEAEYAAEQVSA